MDPSAPQTVLKGTAITSSLCGTVAGIYGGLKHGAPSKFFVHTVVNSGIVAATFFSIREYLVSPVLVSALTGKQYRLRRQRLYHPTMLEESGALSWTDIRMSRLLDSGISGGLTGGVLNAWKRGRRGFTPGLTTGVLVCTLLQWSFNELNIFRIRYISVKSAAPIQHVIRNPIVVDERSLEEPPAPTAIQLTPVATLSHSLLDRILSAFGQRVSDEKYLERLKAERSSYLRRIAELELEEEKKR